MLDVPVAVAAAVGVLRRRGAAGMLLGRLGHPERRRLPKHQGDLGVVGPRSPHERVQPGPVVDARRGFDLVPVDAGVPESQRADLGLGPALGLAVVHPEEVLRDGHARRCGSRLGGHQHGGQHGSDRGGDQAGGHPETTTDQGHERDLRLEGAHGRGMGGQSPTAGTSHSVPDDHRSAQPKDDESGHACHLTVDQSPPDTTSPPRGGRRSALQSARWRPAARNGPRHRPAPDRRRPPR